MEEKTIENKDEIMCQQFGCQLPAEYIVYWPNQTTKQCFEHMRKVVDLGKLMGIQVPITPL